MRRINIKVIANSSRELVEKIDDSSYKIWVKSKPIEGEANKAVINILATFFGVPKRSLRIVLGKKNNKKVIEIID